MRRKKPTNYRRSFNPNGNYTHMDSEQIPTESPTNGTRREKLRNPLTLDEFLKQIHGAAVQIKLSDQTGYT